MPNNVIDFGKIKREKYGGLLAIKTARFCSCRKLTVDEEERTLVCARCNKKHDPIDYVASIAKQDHRSVKERELLNQEIRELSETVRKLKRQRTDLNRQVKMMNFELEKSRVELESLRPTIVKDRLSDIFIRK